MNTNVSESKNNEFCKCCGKPLVEEVFVWDSDVMDYVLLGEDGIPQKDKRLTEDHYEALNKHAIESISKRKRERS